MNRCQILLKILGNIVTINRRYLFQKKYFYDYKINFNFLAMLKSRIWSDLSKFTLDKIQQASSTLSRYY